MSIWVPPCPLSPARESAEENAQRRGSEIAVMMYGILSYAVSGRPGPGHIIEAADAQVSKVTKHTRAEI